MIFKMALRHRQVLLFLLCVLSAVPWASVLASESRPAPLTPIAADRIASGRTTAYSSVGTPVLRMAGAAGADAGMLLSPDQLVREVWQRNPGIDAMRAATGASARIESAGALDDPVVSYAIAPRTAREYPLPNQNVQVSQGFPWPGTLDLRRKVAEAEAQSANEQVADLRLRLAARARADYAEWYYVYRALAINAQNQALVTRLRSVAEASYASGQSPQQDVLQAEVERIRLSNQASYLHVFDKRFKQRSTRY